MRLVASGRRPFGFSSEGAVVGPFSVQGTRDASGRKLSRLELFGSPI